MNENFRILLIDDDEFNSIIIRKFLERTFPSIYSVKDSSEAIGILKNTKLDLIITDIAITGSEMSGIEILHYVKEHYPSVKMIALTGSALQGDRQKFIDLGFDEYIKKPYEREQLIELVKSFA